MSHGRGGRELERPELTIDELVRLRATAEEWGKKASFGVKTFWRDGGSFSKDSSKLPEPGDAPHITTTARAYIALMYADRAKKREGAPETPSWAEAFAKFGSERRIDIASRFVETANKKSEVNIFDVAHLADFIQVGDYLDRFYPRPKGGGGAPAGWLSSSFFRLGARARADAKVAIRSALVRALENSVGAKERGQVEFEVGNDESRHYFATLHALRTLHVLKDWNAGADEKSLKDDVLENIVVGARAFAIEQSFFFQRDVRHRQDPVRLAFAGCIYILHARNVDRDLCLSIIEALHASQQPNGSWPATHPVIRKKSRLPWHIASHEVALCLTWLYFQPHVPDAARPLLLEMMQRYLISAVIPTFVRLPKTGQPDKYWEGWQDDHKLSTDVAVGWATAIVGHFLSNFSFVLTDWINRRVIEELGLQASTRNYLIDDTNEEGKRSLRWLPAAGAEAIWPDLPKHAWDMPARTAEALAEEIAKKWTDPSDGKTSSKDLAAKVLHPIMLSPSEQPLKNRCAGMLPGKPGTRKTSLVSRLSLAIRWPMIAVPASVIFERGFDMMEAQASHVFGNLNHLRGCVIFFDEFEEFFRRRVAKHGKKDGNASDSTDSALLEKERNEEGEVVDATPHGRTIASFTTSAMLPRLQELHDQARCLIFLATNHSDQIDPAIKRRGRFDFKLHVGYPSAERLKEYLSERWGDELKKRDLANDIAAALDKIEGEAREKLRFEYVESLINSPPRPTANESRIDAIVKELNERIRQDTDSDDPPELAGL